MTANELNLLIDILERRGEDRQLEAATMLRQQQAEIEALHNKMINLSFDLAYANRTDEFRKEARCVACGWNPNLIGGERNDSGFYMSDAEHYKLKCESQQAEIEALKEQSEDCTCQGGHSEAYLKAKGKLK